MTEPTQRHTNTPRCQHTHNGHQCQLDAGHDNTHGTMCVYTTISTELNGDTITRFNQHGAKTMPMPSKPYIDEPPKAPPKGQCQICGNEVERRIYKYCSHMCRLKARRMRYVAREDAA